MILTNEGGVILKYSLDRDMQAMLQFLITKQQLSK